MIGLAAVARNTDPELPDGLPGAIEVADDEPPTAQGLPQLAAAALLMPGAEVDPSRRPHDDRGALAVEVVRAESEDARPRSRPIAASYALMR